MFKHDRSHFGLGVVATIGALFLVLTVAAFAAPRAPLPPPQAHAPIHYTQVSAPIGRVQPSKGSGNSGGHGGHGGGTTTAVVYTPANIQSAYDFGTYANGAGQTIAIIDAYGDPTLAADVAAFDSKFGLPAATITVDYPDGQPTSANSNWAIETALDVEWAHANAPEANILLIVTPDSSLQHLLDGITSAVNTSGVTAISMSWGASESTYASYGFLASYENAFQAAVGKGIDLLAAAGDSGSTCGHGRSAQACVYYPASSPEVMGVGGTTLALNSSGGYGSESVWSGTGGGYSSQFSEPGYQATASILDPSGIRGVPDVAFDADPNTGVYVAANGSWYAVGGTSVGSPNWAAIVADSVATGLHLSSSYLYGTAYGADGSSSLYASEIHDVTSGSNGTYSAGSGWDPITGIGSPNVANLISGK